MMLPRDPTDVAQLLCSGRWKKKHILSFRAQFGDEALFEVLRQPFAHDGSAAEALASFHCQQITGSLLLEMMPKCTVPLRDAMHQSLAVWNLSVEEWPFYLCRNFGIDNVAATIEDIASNESLDETQQRAIETFRFWLRGNRDTILGTSSTE